MRSIHKFIINLLCFSSLVFLITQCAPKKDEDVHEPVTRYEPTIIQLNDLQLKSADIKLGKIEQRTLSGILRATGKLDVPPQNLVSIAAPFGGFLQATEMLQGKHVHKGERIATIQNPEYVQLQQNYLDGKSQLEFLEAEFERQKALAQQNVNAQKSEQQSKSAYFSKLAIVNGLHARLKMLNINVTSLASGEISSTIPLYSPIDGFVTEVNFNIGSFVSPTDVLFKIVDTSHLHAELTVFEKDITKVKQNQLVRFTLPGSTDERLATVYLIGREILADRTVRIHCHLEKEEANLLPGMYISAIVELGSNPVAALPDQAIVNFEGKHYIFIPEGKTRSFKLLEVKTGISENGYTEIIPSDSLTLKASDIVINGAYSLLSQMKNSDDEE